MKRKIFFITAVLMTGILFTACGDKQGVSNEEVADAPMTAPADIAPDVPELETAVTPETAPPVD